MEDGKSVTVGNKECQEETHRDNINLALKANRVVYRGEKYWKILEFSAYEGEELPFKYFDELPVCFKIKGKLEIHYSDVTSIRLGVGGLISDKEYRHVVRVLRFCGKKLHLINEDIKKIKAEWTGEEEIII